MWRTAAGEILANTMVHILYSLYSYCQESKKIAGINYSRVMTFFQDNTFDTFLQSWQKF